MSNWWQHLSWSHGVLALGLMAYGIAVAAWLLRSGRDMPPPRWDPRSTLNQFHNENGTNHVRTRRMVK